LSLRLKILTESQARMLYGGSFQFIDSSRMSNGIDVWIDYYMYV